MRPALERIRMPISKTLGLSAFVFLSLLVFPAWLEGADPQDYQKLKETGICRRCNLERVDLQGAQLKGVNLGGANLKNADLTLTNLESANLGGADLRGAKLDRAFMNEAILCNTIMPDGRIEYSGCLLPTLKQLLNAFEQR